MSEIEKMYENAGIYRCNMPDIDCNKNCEKCEDYNLFTATKQLELIEFYIKSVWWLNLACFKNSNLPFDEELAKLTNHLWEDMTISQREQIADILKG